MEKVILVDEQDNAVGAMEKIEAHKKGMLHRAFSILLFNSKGEVLLQKRAKEKYHSGGLWTNTCCSHPSPDETMEAALNRKLKQEMGIDLHPEFSYKFIYKHTFENGLTEYEFDHVFTAIFNGEPHINTQEVEHWKYIDLRSLKEDISQHPENYTYWFKLIIQKFH